MPFLRVENQRFVDTQNREVILNGINHVVKDPAQNYLYPDDEQLFQAFREYGFNCIRYGIIWDGLDLSRVSSMKSTCKRLINGFDGLKKTESGWF